MAMPRAMLELLLVVATMAMLASGKPSKNIEEVGLFRINPELYRVLEGTDNLKPKCPPRRGPGGGGKGNNGEERVNFAVTADGDCCTTTTHMAPEGHHFYMVVTSVKSIEGEEGQPGGTVQFVDVDAAFGSRLILETGENINQLEDPAILKPTETSLVMVHVCGHEGKKSKVVYSMTSFDAGEGGVPDTGF